MNCGYFGILFVTTLMASPAEKARDHLQHGRYAEAVEAYAALAEESPPNEEVIRGWSRALWTQGERDAAEAVLTKVLSSDGKSPRLQAELARQRFERGRYADAQTAVDATLQLHPDEPLARWIQAELLTERGDIKAALEGYRWFVRYYNRVQPTDAETLTIVARGTAQYARWQSVSQIFDFTVNTLCSDAEKNDPACWEAYAIAGGLLLEKYNESEGKPELTKGLAINPRAIAIHRTLAASFTEELAFAKAEQAIARALEIDAHDPESLRIAAEMAMLQGDFPTANQHLKESLAGNPMPQKTLALQVSLMMLQDGVPPPERFEDLLKHLDKIAEWKPEPTPPEAIIVELAKRNPRPGYFLNELGRLFETQRKFALAEKCYRQAIVTMPQLSRPKTELGRLLFQTGRVAEAKKLLDDAFKADPYHVRVSNLRKVMRVLDDYAATTTPHFVIRADAQLDAVLARYMGEYLEEIYPTITGEYGYEPPQRTQIEIYNKAKGLAGHQWFSARMVGLPWIQTIGASTGMIVALTSPSATEEPFNWARVLKHEFIHVVTLQQTDFNIPHWYTEALATRSEGYPMPMEWNRLLQQRVAANNLRNLDNLHLGFQKAESRDDWNFAYCQSVLYSDYFEQRFGKEALAKLLDAYRTTRSTDVAVRTAFAVDKADLEAGYVQFLKDRVSRLATVGTLPELDAAQVRKDFVDRPDDPDVRAAYAEWQMRQGKFSSAESQAQAVLDENSHHVRGALVVARCQMQREDLEGAEETLAKAWQADRPQPQLSAVLGQVRLKLKDMDGALTVFNAAQKTVPDDPQWPRGIATVALARGDRTMRLTALERVTAIDPDDVKSRKTLAEEAFKDGDGARTVRFAKLALQIDVLDAEIHRLLARGFGIEKNTAGAVTEWDVACQLQPGQPDSEIELARALRNVGRNEDARERVQKVLKKNPDHRAAIELAKELESP